MHKRIAQRSKLISRDFKTSANSIENSPFRGFEKQPTVLIERFNIEPFLNKQSLNTRKFRRQSVKGTQKTLPQLVSDCTVKLVREDLQQLKKEILENSLLNKGKSRGILITPTLHCNICEKAYSKEKDLQDHVENKHKLIYKAEVRRKSNNKRVSFSDQIIVHELKQYHKCKKCTKIFEKYSFLKTHMKLEHKKRKCYICNYCSKKFVDRMIFKVHIKLHCDVCGVLFANKREYLIHRRDSCRLVKKYPCKTCEDQFFSYMDLKDHSYEHLEDLYVCDICKTQQSTKCAITHHILFLHSSRRPNKKFTNRKLGFEKLYLCNFCEVSSLEKHVIDRHLSVLPDLYNRECTGYKDYYFCDQCSTKFDTEASMLQHKWSHFLNASDNSQVQPEKKLSKPAKLQEKIKLQEIPDLQHPKVVLEKVNGLELNNELSINNNLDAQSEDSIENQKKEVENTKSVTETNQLKCIEEVNVTNETCDPKTSEVGPGNDKEIVDLTNEEDCSSADKISVLSTLLTTKQVDELPNGKVISGIIKNAIVDPKSKKTLFSKYQCQKCHKFYSSNSTLKRHILSMHSTFSNLQCQLCEETFVWPSLLESHKCIRMNIPEMPFEDARPEIQFENYRNFGQNGFEDPMNITPDENYMDSVDFQIPPVVEMPQYGRTNPSGYVTQQLVNYALPVRNNYKIVMQEVPIEF